MSILIHMNKPKDCGKCFVGDRTMCQQGCPLIELPPHGDLIDREKIPFVESENGCQDDYAFRYDINELTPVIPKEEE